MKFAIQITVITEGAFSLETKSLKKSDTRIIIDIYNGFNPIQFHTLEPVPDCRLHGFGHIAPPPIVGTQIATDLGPHTLLIPPVKTAGTDKPTIFLMYDSPTILGLSPGAQIEPNKIPGLAAI